MKSDAPSPVAQLAALYHTDETAWLETMARLAADRRSEEFDYEHLSEFLADMALRDKREVLSRLTTLSMHLMKWEHQPGHRSPSRQSTIVEQRSELNDLLESDTLRNYAREVLDKAYGRAVKRAALETGLAEDVFPSSCPLALEEILGAD